MMPREFERRLDEVARRLRLVRRRTEIARTAFWFAVIGLVGYGIAYWQPGFAQPILVATAAAAAAGVVAFTLSQPRRNPADDVAAVQRIEAEFPDLDARLLTAAEQRPDVLTGKLHFLQSRLLEEVGDHARTHDWSRVVPATLLGRAWRRQAAALVALLLVSLGWISLTVSANPITGSMPSVQSARSAQRTDYAVDPGDVQIERGQSLLALIRFQNNPPRDVTLRWQSGDGPVQRLTMTKNLDDPVFAGHIAAVAADGKYRLEFDDVLTPEFAVTVYDLPALVKSTLIVAAPAYTDREPQVFDNASVATVIEGSEARLECRVNKPLAKVELFDAKNGMTLPLFATNENEYATAWQPDRSRHWELRLTDADGRANCDPIEIVIDVAPNRRPEIKPVFPGQDQRVSSLQELALESRVSDDFGLVRTGLVIDGAAKESITVPLTETLSGGEAHPLTNLLALETYGLEAGNVVSYSFFADDIGPDGQPRRTMGDLYFLEVRPFEESYRQMEGAGGQSGAQAASSGQGQQLDKLIEVQKQIVTAAWNIQRRYPKFENAEELAAADALRESQQHAHDQFEQLSEALAEAVPAEKIRDIFESMSRAIEEFTGVGETREPVHLTNGLQAARTAFQGLVRLKPKDHRIMQGAQSGGGGGGGGGASQQQLNQLELDGEANRYETEKSARQQPDASQAKEQLAVLNRLKDLAARQEALNQRLKDLDAELRAAQTAAEREELERQLRQLRDEQQDVLEDADALRNRLEKSSRQDQTTDARKQLEEMRPQLVDAAESLKEGKLNQALNSGTRAERELNKLQDDFRKQSSAQLAEAMQQLRAEACELVENEAKAKESLEQMRDRQSQSLRQRQEREQLARSLAEQKTQLDELLKSIRETVQAAETSEPLAAKKLYEAVREAQQQKTDKALTAAAQLVQQGFLPEAAQAEEIARKGLNELQEGIESAAESILGDELADLKRAKRELAELASELGKERGEGGEQQQSSGEGEGKPQDGSQPGESSKENGEKGQSPNGTKPGEEGLEGTQPEKSPGEKGSQGNSPSPEGANSGEGEGTGAPNGQERGGLRGALKRRSQNGQGQGGGSPQAGQSSGNTQGGGASAPGGPITGGNYGEWTDRLRDVETLIDDPELQSEIAKVREEARSLRADFKRHSEVPTWELMDDHLRKPLVELQRKLAEEIARRESPDALVPTDRDPVPERYRELVRQYYERLGSGRK